MLLSLVIMQHPQAPVHRIFSPTKFPGLPGKTPHTTNRGHFAVTYFYWDRLIGVFENITKQQQTLKILNIMKTKILSFVTIAAIVLGISNTTFAATKNDSAAKNNEVSTVLTNVSKISKIEIHGNVELYVTDGSADQVKVYNRYYAESAMVQNQNGVLRISSYSAKKLVVWVSAYDLRSITAYDNAEVRSFGKLAPVGMEITLHNNSYANLDMNGYSANIIVNDRAKADLTGNVTDCSLKCSKSSSVNSTNFVADNMNRTDSDPAKKNIEQEFVGL